MRYEGPAVSDRVEDDDTKPSSWQPPCYLCDDEMFVQNGGEVIPCPECNPDGDLE